MKNRALTIILGLLVGAGIWLADYWTKNLVISEKLATAPVFSSWVQITIHHNYGLLGNLPFPKWSIFVLTALALSLLAYGLYDALKNKSAYNFLTLSVVMGGALGNLYDRLAYGYVFDWLMLFRTSIINLADAAITVGLVMYAVGHLKRKAREQERV